MSDLRNSGFIVLLALILGDSAVADLIFESPEIEDSEHEHVPARTQP